MACISKAWFSSNIHKIKVLALTISIFIASPLILIIIFLLHVARRLISICAAVSQKDFDKIISPSNSIYASDDLYGIPNHNTVLWFVLKGQVSIDSLQSTIYEKAVSKPVSGSRLAYPQLKQYPVPFYKFMFWKWDEDFKIDRHVYVHKKAKDDNRQWTEADLLEIQQNLLRKQWTRHRSPWEVFLIPNFRSGSSYRESTVMFLRFHACLGDSFSWFRMFIRNICDCDNEDGHHVPQYKSGPSSMSHFEPSAEHLQYSYTKMSHLVSLILTPFKVPYHFSQQVLEPFDSNEWKVPDSRLIKRDHLSVVDKFSVQHIKDIKNTLGVSFTAVLLAATASAIRSTFITMGLRIPRSMKMSFPLQTKSDFKDNLDTMQSVSCIQLPVGIASSKDRVRICEEMCQRARNSSLAESNTILTTLLGLLPTKYFKYAFRNQPWTGTLVNLPCSVEYLSIADHPIEDFVVAPTSNAGFVISFSSYADYIRMSLVIDHRLIPPYSESVAKDLLKSIYSEFVLLGIEGIV